MVESEKTAKWQYTQQCEELSSEIKKLRAEVTRETKRERVRIFSILKLNEKTNWIFFLCRFVVCDVNIRIVHRFVLVQ